MSEFRDTRPGITLDLSDPIVLEAACEVDAMLPDSPPLVPREVHVPNWACAAQAAGLSSQDIAMMQLQAGRCIEVNATPSQLAQGMIGNALRAAVEQRSILWPWSTSNEVNIRRR